MSLTKWDPFKGMNTFFSDEDFFPTRDLALDIFEEKGAIIVTLHVPGANKKNFCISVEGKLLYVSGSRNKNIEVKKKNYYRQEIKRGSFSRTIPLPSLVKSEKATATYKEGILRIILPKQKNKKKDSMTIPVK